MITWIFNCVKHLMKLRYKFFKERRICILPLVEVKEKRLFSEGEGTFLKYVPTLDELIEFFKEMIKNSVWKKQEIKQMVRLNLEKYHMGIHYTDVIKKVN
jgi:hypothetical protein